MSRRILDKDIVHIEKERILDFYQNVIWLYRPWTEIVDLLGEAVGLEITVDETESSVGDFNSDISVLGFI